MLDLADAPLARAGEGAGLMAEHLALEDLLGHRAAVQRDERLVVARRQRVQAARDQFLAGAGLAVDEHRRVGGGHVIDQRAHRGHRLGAADDARARRRPRQLAAQGAVFQLQRAALDGAAHGLGQALGGERLLDEIERAVAHRLHGHRDIAVAGHEHHRNAGAERLAMRQHVEPAGARQAQVADDHAVEIGVDPADRLLGAGVGLDLEAGKLQALRGGLADGRIVFDEENVQAFGHGSFG